MVFTFQTLMVFPSGGNYLIPPPKNEAVTSSCILVILSASRTEARCYQGFPWKLRLYKEQSRGKKKTLVPYARRGFIPSEQRFNSCPVVSIPPEGDLLGFSPPDLC